VKQIPPTIKSIRFQAYFVITCECLLSVEIY
jgi:hypothetical protein